MADSSLSGRVVTRSEVLGAPDTPIGVGTVIAVADEHTDELWTLIGMAPPPAERLACLEFHIERPALERLSAATAPINLDGTFDLGLPPGPHLLCLSGITANPAVGGLEVVGCVYGVVPPESAVWSLSYGNGGVMLVGP